MSYSKNFLRAVFLLMIVISSCSSDPQTFEEEVRHVYQRQKGFYFIKIPPALLSVVVRATEDQGMIDFFGDARQVGIISFGEERPDDENNKLVKSLEEMLGRYDFEDLIRISDSEKSISIKIKENNGKVTDLVTIVSGKPGPVTAITLSGEIDVETIIKAAGDFDYDMLMRMPGIGR
jgi:hypothetical protein